MIRPGAAGAAKAGGFLFAVSLSFGFIGVVVEIAWASWFRLPDGVEPLLVSLSCRYWLSRVPPWCT